MISCCFGNWISKYIRINHTGKSFVCRYGLNSFNSCSKLQLLSGVCVQSYAHTSSCGPAWVLKCIQNAHFPPSHSAWRAHRACHSRCLWSQGEKFFQKFKLNLIRHSGPSWSISKLSFQPCLPLWMCYKPCQKHHPFTNWGNEAKAKGDYPIIVRNHVRILSRREAGSDILFNSQMTVWKTDPEGKREMVH